MNTLGPKAYTVRKIFMQDNIDTPAKSKPSANNMNTQLNSGANAYKVHNIIILCKLLIYYTHVRITNTRYKVPKTYDALCRIHPPSTV